MKLKFNLTSLQQRLILLLVLPTALFLIGAGIAGYVSIKKSLLDEWQKVAILRLARAAHEMDMRLSQSKHWLALFAQEAAKPHQKEVLDWILEQLAREASVRQVKVVWGSPKNLASRPATTDKFQEVKKVSPPRYFYPPGYESVGLESDLLSEHGKLLGKLEVLLKLPYLMENIVASGWMQTNMACLLNDNGLYLAHSKLTMKNRHCLGETHDPLEVAMLKEMQKKPYGTLISRGFMPGKVVGFYKLHQAPWAIMLHARGSQILAPIMRFQSLYLLSILLCLTVILGMMHLAIRPLIASIQQIAHRAALVARGRYGEPIPVHSQDEIGQLTASFNDMVEGLKERDLISNTFGRYVDQEVAQELLSRPEAARLGGKKREVVILFSDLRDFTPLAETLSPEATIKLVNHHFSQMIEVLQQHRGIIVDFLGDAILAFFDPLDGPVAPTVRRAIRCALHMEKAVARQNGTDSQFPPLQMGIGLHVGEVVVGNIGSETRAKYGIVGAAVNLTNRIQAQAQGGEVVISEATYHQIPEELVIRRSFRATLKGIQEPTDLYVVGDLIEQTRN
jgi:adenylate cyclase